MATGYCSAASEGCSRMPIGSRGPRYLGTRARASPPVMRRQRLWHLCVKALNIAARVLIALE